MSTLIFTEQALISSDSSRFFSTPVFFKYFAAIVAMSMSVTFFFERRSP